MKKIAALFLALQLFVIPGAGYAQTIGASTLPLDDSLNATLSYGKAPGKTIGNERNFLDPLNYPLVEKGDLTGHLWDYYSNYHSIYFEEVTARYPSDDMNVILRYGSEKATSKDYNLRIEFFKEAGNSLRFEGSTAFSTYGYIAVNLNSAMAKQDFKDQQYIYLRVGILKNGYDQYYAADTTFKVANPFYADATTSLDKFAVISNESVEPNMMQSTGVFNLKSINTSAAKGLEESAYQLDINKPFDARLSKGNFIKKSTYAVAPTYNVGDNSNFWVQNQINNDNYQINARLAYKGSKANVWVNNYQISDADAEKLGQEFDNKIYSTVTNNFGMESDVDHDGKVNILCYDIQDGFAGSGSFVGGYFWSRDLYNTIYSNHSEIFYIDTYPAMGTSDSKDVSMAYHILAHEFQHMVNYNENVLIEGNSEMDTWLDEGLAMASEQIYTGEGLANRVDYYNSSTSIQNGHSLLNWDYDGDVLSNYSLSYLFLQYVKIQANQGDRIFGEIIKDPNSDYKAIEDVAKKYISPDMTFGKLMTDFRIALFLKKPTGLYGFKGDPFFDSLNQKIYTGSSAMLYGGGAIATSFNLTNGNILPLSRGQNITYTFLQDPTDVTPPESPTVNQIGDSDTQITGSTEANATVVATAGQYEIGRGNSNSGNFTVKIPHLPAGTVIQVYSEDVFGNISLPTNVVVSDLTAPMKPFVYDVTDHDSSMMGKAEAGSTITVKADGTVVGTVIANPDGGFEVMIPKQRAGMILMITATDAAGNVSLPTEVTVKDTEEPTINGAVDTEIIMGEAFDGLQGVTSFDNLDGNLTSSITIEGTVNTKKKGVYILTYTVKDNSGNVTTVTRKITVKDTIKPVISGVTAKTIKLNSSFNPKSGVTAKDNADGNLTTIIKVTGTVNTKKKGIYSITYTVIDKSGNKTIVTRKITVK